MTTLLTTEVLADAREAEFCNDLRSLRESLYFAWPDTDLDPEIEDAEVYRLSAYWLSQHGRDQKLPDCQRRAMDYFAKSALLFEIDGDDESAAYARVGEANCYLYLGAVEEYEIILRSIAAEFPQNHSVNIKIKAHHIQSFNRQRKYREAFDVMNGVWKSVDDCPNLKIKAQFHNAAGITWHGLGETEKSFIHFNAALELAHQIGNAQYVGMNLNQLAMAYLQEDDFEAAHLHIADSLSIVSTGWVPHGYDTQALIYLAENKIPEALASIDKAIKLFTGTDDYSGLADALFTKCRCELRISEVDAKRTLDELCEVASVYTGEVKRYLDLFEEEKAVLQKEDDVIARRIVRTGDLYHFPSVVMRNLGTDRACTGKAVKMASYAPGMVILYIYEKEYFIAKLHYDKGFKLSVLEPTMHAPEDVKIVGAVTEFQKI